LLHALVKNSPAILSREEIISHVWRTAAVVNLVDTHLHNLRRKLPPELAGKVQAVPGKGYRYLG
jgi:DNA-binding response OmpR family regulator